MLATAGVVRVSLSRGLCAVVDESDLCLVQSASWHAFKRSDGHGFYAENHVGFMHRIIACADYGQLVDHIDGDGLNNRRDNLRICTPSQNQWNQYRPRGKSRFKGVTWHKQLGKWQAEVRANNKRHYLGLFADELEAALAYNIAAAELHGEFARLNILPEADTTARLSVEILRA